MAILLLPLFLVVSQVWGIDCGMTQSQISNIVRDHNTARRTQANPPSSKMKTMQWDPILAQVAYNYLKSFDCGGWNFEHNDNRDNDYKALGGCNGDTVGENWYSGPPDAASDSSLGAGAVAAWTNHQCFSRSWSGTKARCNQAECSEADYFYNNSHPETGAPCSPYGIDFGLVAHFTQVMWAETAWVGCAYTEACGTLCNYAPAGNFNLPSRFTPSDIWG